MASSLAEPDADVRATRPRVHQHRLAQQLVTGRSLGGEAVARIPIHQIADVPLGRILDPEVEHADDGECPELAGLDVELGDADQFALLDQIAYDAFGNIVTQLNPLLANPILFASREFDAETGLYYNRARYLDPTTGRWTTQDPMGFAAGDANLYRYVGNMATMATDPNGLDRLIIVGNKVSFERTYYITPWSNGGTYSIGSLIEYEGVQYVRHGRYLVPLEQVRDAIERTFTVGYGGEWRADSNKITEWFRANDVSSEVAKPHDQRKVADRMFGPTVIAGTMAAITVRAMVTQVTETVLIELATSYGPAKFADFLVWAGKRGIKAVRNSSNELLHLADHNGRQLTKQEIQAAAKEFEQLAPVPRSVKGTLDALPGKKGKTGPIKEVPDQQASDDLFDSLSSGGKTVPSGTYPGVVKNCPTVPLFDDGRGQRAAVRRLTSPCRMALLSRFTSDHECYY